MSRLHICNTFFEREIELFSRQKSLSEWFRSHPSFLQLQFLPLIYADTNDKILVSDLPANPDPRLFLIDDAPKNLPIEHWGPSLAIKKWAEKCHIPYSIPEPNLISELNSKVFSFLNSPKLPGATLLHTEQEVTEWMEKTQGPKVLKTPLGVAGRGHIFSNVKRLYTLPLIGEPWVERVLDFSTQWNHGKLLGVTCFENEPNGTYKRTFTAPVESWALDEHIAIAKPLIEKMMNLGYSGNVGVDAFIYLWKGKKHLHPIVEINGRKTMSWVALKKPLSYIRAQEGVLPNELIVNKKTVRFSRNLI